MINIEKAKEQVEKSFTVRLEKEYDKTGISHIIEAEVKFVLDISGSMNISSLSGKLYDNGVINDIVQRFFAVAKVLDDNGEMEIYPFSNICEELKIPVNDKNYINYVNDEIMNKKKNWYFSGTDYVPMIRKIINDSGNMPQLILCVVDGDTRNKETAKKLIIESSNKPIFWLFIGIGNNENFTFLESLDNMDESKRKIDNVDFHKINDITKLVDKELYDMIANEFIPWFYKAKELKIF